MIPWEVRYKEQLVSHKHFSQWYLAHLFTSELHLENVIFFLGVGPLAGSRVLRPEVLAWWVEAPRDWDILVLDFKFEREGS